MKKVAKAEETFGCVVCRSIRQKILHQLFFCLISFFFFFYITTLLSQLFKFDKIGKTEKKKDYQKVSLKM